MKTRLQWPLFTLLLTLLCLGGSSDVSAQGLEDFTNSNATTSYDDDFFVGNGGITWSYVHSRDANNDTNNSGINLPALMLREVSKGSKITSSAIPGGIGNFSVKLYKGFTGGGNRQVEIFVNGISQGTSIPFDNFNEQIFTVNNINISGNVIIEIRNITSKQIIIDDISWTAFSGVTPILSASPTTITGLDYIVGNGPSASQSFELSGANLNGDDVDVVLPALSDFEISADNTNFSDSLNFTAFDGTATTIYVRLKAGLAINTYTDDITISGGGATQNTTVTLNGEVQPEPVLGWQINTTNNEYVIDFDNTVIGVNEGQYAGTGFETSPATGRLNSNAFATTGMSDGDTSFGGGPYTTGDYIGETSTGGVSSGGFYAFEVATANRAFGWQATASDFNPGSIILRLQNQTGGSLETLRVTYTVYVYNDQGRSNNVSFSYSNDNNTFTQQPLLEVISEETAATSAAWIATTYTVLIGFINIPDNAFYYLRWNTNDVSGGGSRDEFAIDDIRLTANPGNLVYTQTGVLSFPVYHTTGSLEAGDDLLAISDPIEFNTGDMDFGNITINPGAEVAFIDNLKISGDLINNGFLTFNSNTNTTAQLDVVPSTSSILGEVGIQRYIPARRAFRLLSSAVTTTTTINSNWQEGQNNTGANFPGDNSNTNPGFGTHITGSTTGENGFDATPSGNPSLFTLNNAAQSWEAVTNTDVNTITAGTAYRLMVRGDRSINLTDNAATPTNTTLRTTGTLHTGPLTVNNLSAVANEFNFFGNPYPAAVDMNDVIAASTNINSNFYYIWDPTLSGANGRGAYVTIDLSDGDGTNTVGSAGNRYLQPGQAAFVLTLANGAASLQFEETQKNVVAPQTTVFDISSQMDVRLYRAAAYAAGETPSDGLRLKFGTDNTNAITSLDAPKFYNQDENLASSNDDRLWSIESRALPEEGESIPLFTNAYRTTDYVFEAILTEVNDINVLLRDHYTGTDTLLENNDNTLYAFTIDPDDAASSATDRFEIVFEELLSTIDVAFGNGFVLFPNPAQGEITLATKGINSEEVQLSMTNLLGQTVYTQTQTVKANGQLTLDASSLSQGVYVLKLTHNKGQFTTKFIKK